MSVVSRSADRAKPLRPLSDEDWARLAEVIRADRARLLADPYFTDEVREGFDDKGVCQVCGEPNHDHEHEPFDLIVIDEP